MEELFELRSYIEKRHYAKALTLIGETEEMSRNVDDALYFGEISLESLGAGKLNTG